MFNKVIVNKECTNMLTRLKAKYRAIFEERNFLEALTYLFVYIMNKITYTEIFRIMVLDPRTAKKSLKTNDQFYFFKCTPQELQNYQYNVHRLNNNFVQEALKRNDFLYGCTVQNTDQIIAYGWYAYQPTIINNHLVFHFSQNYLYMFNGYTEPDYRGYRLHGIAMGLCAINAPSYGKKGLISYVNAENYRSLHSCKRLGYDIVGTILAIKLLNKTYIFSTKGCKKYDVFLEAIH
jgi:hypothetical protein